MAISLRPYQEQAVGSVMQSWSRYNSVLLTMATGGGKTAVFLTILHRVLQNGDRALILAHRKELIEQPIDRMLSYYPDWEGKIGIVMAERNECDKQIVVATVQTLVSGTRLQQCLDHGSFRYIITDEAHHSEAETYQTIYKALREDNPDISHLGVTATPIRADGNSLGNTFQHEAGHYGIRELINEKYLAPVRWLAIQLRVSVADVATRAGDFVAGQLADVFEVDNTFDQVVRAHQMYGGDRQAIAFVVSVAGAHRLAEKFRDAGISAEAADAGTNKKERARILHDFAAGKTRVLCNVGLYTEGLDVPQASLIHQVRPTKSDGLYTQMIGRALRTYPGKEDALILDYCPIEKRNIVFAGDVLAIPVRRDVLIKEDGDEGEAIGGFTYDGRFNYMDGSAAEIVSRKLDYLEMSSFSWHSSGDGTMSLGLGEARDGYERILFLTAPDENGLVRLYGVARRCESKDSDDGSYGRTVSPWRSYMILESEWEEVSKMADQLAEKHHNAVLAAKGKTWRKLPPTDGQIKLAKRIGGYKPEMNRGQVSDLISHQIARREIGR